MTDTFSTIERSRIMALVRSSDTSPELKVRRVLHAAGFRYRLHVKMLPGNPDIVLRSYRAVVFVHGCLWHGHGCKRFRLPNTNRNYWLRKIERNKTRDEANARALDKMGWRVRIVWECQLRSDIASLLTWLRGLLAEQAV